jgi:ribosomal protein RSM22 (predicted rRNA methylase)
VPLTLARAIEAVLDGEDLGALRRATGRLIEAYRSGSPPDAPVLRDPAAAAAYAAYRMPATYAAVSRALRMGLATGPPMRVRTLVDLGGGTGAAAWAAAEAFPELTAVTVLDGSPDALERGRRIAAHGPPPLAGARWLRALLAPGTPVEPADLATVSYVLGELGTEVQAGVVDAAAAAAGLVLVVEPGTPRGFAAALAARERLVAGGWHVVAPCPQDGPCPVAARTGDWCHFSVRLDRTALHRRLKGAELGHEDEKFSFVLASRETVGEREPRVLRHPVRRKGLVRLEVCRPDGTAGPEVVTRRNRVAYREARDADWGSALTSPESSATGGSDA